MKPGFASFGVLAIIFSALQFLWIGLIIKSGRDSEQTSMAERDSEFQRNHQDNLIDNELSIKDKRKKLEELFNR